MAIPVDTSLGVSFPYRSCDRRHTHTTVERSTALEIPVLCLRWSHANINGNMMFGHNNEYHSNPKCMTILMKAQQQYRGITKTNKFWTVINAYAQKHDGAAVEPHRFQTRTLLHSSRQSYHIIMMYFDRLNPPTHLPQLSATSIHPTHLPNPSKHLNFTSSEAPSLQPAISPAPFHSQAHPTYSINPEPPVPYLFPLP